MSERQRKKVGRSCLLRLEDVGASILAHEGSVGIVATYICGDVSTTKISGNEINRTNLCGDGDAEEVDKTNVPVPRDHDLVNQAGPAEVIPQLTLRRVLI